jgi:hypothetical protein
VDSAVVPVLTETRVVEAAAAGILEEVEWVTRTVAAAGEEVIQLAQLLLLDITTVPAT